jgi:hypothetical protein
VKNRQNEENCEIQDQKDRKEDCRWARLAVVKLAGAGREKR